MTIIEILALIFASSISALIRFKLSSSLDKSDFPLGTLISNMLACFILACLLAFGQKYDLRNSENSLLYFNVLILEISTGVLSTYSSFAYQLSKMLIEKRLKDFIRYSCYTFGLCLAIFHFTISIIL